MRRRTWLPGAALRALAILAAIPAWAADEKPGPEHARVITLEEAYDLALATDQNIQIAYWEIRKANLAPWSALTRLGPQFNIGAGYSDTQNRALAINTKHESGRLDFSYQQTFVDFSVFPAFHYGRLAELAARLQYQYTIRQTLFGVASAYYQVLSQQRIVEVDAQTVQLAAEQLGVAQKRLNVGEVTPTDALNAMVTLQSAKVALIEAKNTLLLERDTLGNILNLGGDTGFQVALPPDYPMTIPPFEKLLAIGYRNREDLRVGEIAVDQDIAKKGETLAGYAPTIGGGVSDSYSNSRGFYGPQSQVWDASISVSIPVFTGGQREIDVRLAGHQIQEDKLNRDKIAKTVEANVRQAWLNARSLQQSLQALRAQVDAARESYKNERTQYQAGTAASVDVLVALTSLNSSENALAEQVYAFQVALRALEQAAGVFQQERVQQARFK